MGLRWQATPTGQFTLLRDELLAGEMRTVDGDDKDTPFLGAYIGMHA
jgi:hypothetical protein